MISEDRFISVKDVARMTGRGVSTIWQSVKDGQFPSPKKISSRCTRWRLSEVQNWMDSPEEWPSYKGDTNND